MAVVPQRKPLFIKSHEVPLPVINVHVLPDWLRSLQALLDRTPSLQVFQQIL